MFPVIPNGVRAGRACIRGGCDAGLWNAYGDDEGERGADPHRNAPRERIVQPRRGERCEYESEAGAGPRERRYDEALLGQRGIERDAQCGDHTGAVAKPAERAGDDQECERR